MQHFCAILNDFMSTKSLSILIIDDNKARATIIETGLREAGHRDVVIMHNTETVSRDIEKMAPDVIVIDLENPSRDSLEYMFQLSRSVKRPIAMFVDDADQTSIEAAIDAGVSAYIVNGLTQERVKPILDLAVSRFNAFARMEKELNEARNELSGRKTIDKAKGILMASKGLSEEQAYKLLRKTAMNKNRKIVEIAESLVTASSLFGNPD